MATGFRGPLRYRNTGHPLDGAPLDAVGRLSSLAKDNTPDGVRLVYYANDFGLWEGPVAKTAELAGQGGWIITTVDSGGDLAEVVDVRDSGTYGILRMLTNDADNDNLCLRQNGSPWKYVSGKRLWFAIRCAPQTAADGELFFGLAIEGDEDPFDTSPTDGFFFEKAETATKMDFHARQDGASTEKTSIDTSAMVDATMHEYAFQVDAQGNIHVYYDGTEVSAAAIAAGNANIPDDEDLGLYFAVQTGDATTRYFDIDHILIAQER